MGQVVWNRYDYGFTAMASLVRETDTGGILVAGQCYDYTWLMLTDSLGHVDCPTLEFGCITIYSVEVTVINTATSDRLSEQINLTVSPNPFCEELRIRFNLSAIATVSASIFDAQGRRVNALLSEEKLPPGGQQLSFQTANWPPGVYFLQFLVNGQKTSKRLVKVCR